MLPENPAGAVAFRVAAADQDLAAAVEHMAEARRPILWVGGGAMLSDSSPEVCELMELLDAAVITTQSGRGIVPLSMNR